MYSRPHHFKWNSLHNFKLRKSIIQENTLVCSNTQEYQFSEYVLKHCLFGVRLFARQTFTTPKIRTFTTPKFGHFPPPKKNICQEDNCHPQISTYSSWRTSRMGRRRCLTRWSWSTSSRGCVTRWSWSISSRRCLTSWSWSTSSRGRRWKRSFGW